MLGKIIKEWRVYNHRKSSWWQHKRNSRAQEKRGAKEEMATARKTKEARRRNLQQTLILKEWQEQNAGIGGKGQTRNIH